AGVVGSYPDLLFHWNKNTVWNSSTDEEVVRPEALIRQFGSINENPEFWHKISPLSYLDEIVAPIQLHHAVDDPVVPVEFSHKLAEMLKMKRKDVELHTYSNSDHELTTEKSEN